jgi:hypothetical protein
MTVQEWPIVAGALAGLLAVFGTGIKWLVGRIDTQQANAAKMESDARMELSARLHEEIRVLRDELTQARKTHAEELALYRQRVYQLEHFIHEQPGINIPSAEWWPPK